MSFSKPSIATAVLVIAMLSVSRGTIYLRDRSAVPANIFSRNLPTPSMPENFLGHGLDIESDAMLMHAIEVLPAGSITNIYAWRQNVPVIMCRGEDLNPGASNVDDDGNGVVDDWSELGATGSDDLVLAPTDRLAYQSALNDPAARVVSHGAMVPIWSSESNLSLDSALQQIETPAELRWDAIDSQGKLHSRFITLR